MTLAFFGFLRLGELTCNNFNPYIHLIKDCVNFSLNTFGQTPESMAIRNKESKTDPFRMGHTITVWASHAEICPVKALQNYIQLRPPITGPFFIFASGKPLTKQNLTFETRKLLNQAGFNAVNYAGQSYRIGAAATAAKADLLSWLIKTLGRLSSDCYERYINQHQHFQEYQPCWLRH